jgi:hypothetical protein
MELELHNVSQDMEEATTVSRSGLVWLGLLRRRQAALKKTPHAAGLFYFQR